MKAYNIRKIRLKETDSTNHYAATLPVPGNEGMVISNTLKTRRPARGRAELSGSRKKGKTLRSA